MGRGWLAKVRAAVVFVQDNAFSLCYLVRYHLNDKEKVKWQ